MRKRTWKLFLLSLLGTTAIAGAQAVSNPNQIGGTIEFTNTHPEILEVLGRPSDVPAGTGQGLSQATVTATSVGVTPVLNNATVVTPGSGTSTGYQITVESGAPGDGIVYRIDVNARLDSGGNLYRFAGVTTAPVEQEPAPDVTADVRECAGLLDVRWQTAAGNPVAVADGSITANRESAPGSGFFLFQARDIDVPNGSDQEYLAVRGDGSTYRVDVSFRTGSDPYSDQFSFQHTEVVAVSCDEVVEVVCVVPEGQSELGSIEGVVDMLGEHENPSTLITANGGPFGNFRLDLVEADPSEGPYELPNMVPTGERGYSVSSTMSFRLSQRYQYFRSPSLAGLNGSAPVTTGEVTDLGDTFVMAPGYLRGEIFLAGPTTREAGSCLEDIFRASDRDRNGDGVPDDSQLLRDSRFEVRGLPIRATGAAKTASGGLARALFEGELDPATSTFEGSYELALGGLDQENTIWDSADFHLRWLDVATPEVATSYQNSQLNLVELLQPDHEIVPGQTTDVPIRRCFGQLNLAYRSTAGTFFNPNVTGNGRFFGTDFEGRQAAYGVLLGFGLGTPSSITGAADQGNVTLCLPAGNYNLTPSVTSVNPSGGTSSTELPPVLDVVVECRQVKDVTLGLEVELDALPACSDQPSATLTGAAEATGGQGVFVEEVYATVNGGPAIVACTDCGEDPDFAFDVPLEACDNEIRVTARDAFDNVSATTSTTRFDAEGPVLAGCEDISVDVESSAGGAVVDFEVTALDGCDGGLPATCDVTSGSFFPRGATEVTCAAVDACGNESACSFTVDLCRPVKPDVRTQGFWKRQCQGPHPSGEHGNLPSYVGPVSRGATFSDVDGVAALCERLEPAPRNDKCEQAEAQLMALELNLASGRLATCNCLEDPDLGSVSVAEAAAFTDALLADPARSFEDCERAQAIVDRVNDAVTLVECES